MATLAPRAPAFAAAGTALACVLLAPRVSFAQRAPLQLARWDATRAPAVWPPPPFALRLRAWEDPPTERALRRTETLLLEIAVTAAPAITELPVLFVRAREGDR